MEIAIIGAGFTGLSAAYKLTKNNNITIFEKSDFIGGIGSAYDVNSQRLDKFYHHIFNSDEYLIDLIEDLELTDNLKWYEPKNAFYTNKKLYPFTSPFDLLNFSPLSFFDRIRLGMLVFKAKFVKDWSSLENLTSEEWIIKHSSQNVYNKVWKPLMESKFDKDAKDISGTWIWNKFKLRGSTRAKNIKNEQLGYMDNSFEIIASKIKDKILESGATINTNTEVESIEMSNDNKGKILIRTKNDQFAFDKVIFTAAPKRLLTILQGIDQKYKDAVNKITYKSNICISLELKKSLSPFYWVTVADNEIPFVVLVEHTNIITDNRYNSNIVYLSRYLDSKDSLLEKSDSEILDLFIKGLTKIFPNFNRKDIINYKVSRSEDAQPVIPKNYSNIILPFETPVKNLYLSSMSQIYPEDRGLNYAVRLGYQIAKLIKNSSN